MKPKSGRPTLLLGLLALAACAQTIPPGVEPQPGGGGLSSRCTVREVRREQLFDEAGRTMYVEPIAIEANARGDVMLAGARNYLFERSPEGKWRLADEAGDSILGAILRRTGAVRTVPSPVPTRLLGTVRVAARDDGAWDVVFAELKPWTGDIRADSVARLWHGVFDGEQWASLDSLPLPSGATLRIYGASALLRYGDSLAWAMPMKVQGRPVRPVLFEHRSGGWTHEVLPELNIAYVAPAHSDTLGLILAIVHPDRALPMDGNSLFLWARQPVWRMVRKVIPSSREDVHQPQLTTSSEDMVLSWMAEFPDAQAVRRKARAMIGRLDGQQPVTTFDADLTPSGSAVVPIELPGRMRLWALDHMLPNSSQREIRFASDSSGTAVRLGQVRNPFRTGFVVAAPAPAELLVAGGLHIPDQSLVVTLLLRARIGCSQRTP